MPVSKPKIIVDARAAIFDAVTALATATSDTETSAGLKTLTDACRGVEFPMVDVLGIVGTATSALRGKVRDLATRVEALEAQPKGVDYRGVWSRSTAYEKNVLVTHGGSVWCSLVDAGAGESPGSFPTVWRLAVKAGRDGRDAGDR